MILTCPSCGTQYVVKDGAIPPEGRQVRCAACKHSWHQEPESDAGTLELNEASEVTQGEAEPATELAEEAGSPGAEEAEADAADEEESFAEAALIEPRSGPEAEERAYEEAVIEGEAASAPPSESVAEEPAAEDWREPPEAEPASEAETAPDAFSPFVVEDEEAPRRRGGVSKLLIALAVIVALAVAFWFLAPADLKAKMGLASAGASPLQVSNPPHVERIQLASGNQLLTVSGRVINPTGREQVIPPLNAKLTNQAGKLVYSWTIAPPARSLGAGESASFNSAEVNVPPGGEYLTITLGQKA